MVICADTSFLFSLYGNDANSAQALGWTAANRLPLTVSIFNEYELGNALRFAEFRKGIAAGAAALYWSQFEADRAAGRLAAQVCNLAEVLADAQRISASRSLKGGHRSFDILHVAAALQLKATEFLTFDGNQKKLTEAEGLHVPI